MALLSFTRTPNLTASLRLMSLDRKCSSAAKVFDFCSLKIILHSSSEVEETLWAANWMKDYINEVHLTLLLLLEFYIPQIYSSFHSQLGHLPLCFMLYSIPWYMDSQHLVLLWLNHWVLHIDLNGSALSSHCLRMCSRTSFSPMKLKAENQLLKWNVTAMNGETRPPCLSW